MKKLITSVRGFTLVEILIVVGIIGLLASVVLSGLGSTRARGRDARRIADIRQAQQALELYYAKCQVYPGVTGAGADCGASVTSWDSLRQALTDASIGITGLANDPLSANSGSRTYNYAVGNSGQEYVLEAILEDTSPDNALLKDSYKGDTSDFSDVVVGSINCAEAGHYCVRF